MNPMKRKKPAKLTRTTTRTDPRDPPEMCPTHRLPWGTIIDGVIYRCGVPVVKDPAKPPDLNGWRCEVINGKRTVCREESWIKLRVVDPGDIRMFAEWLTRAAAWMEAGQ